jgi:hypothetical protein
MQKWEYLYINTTTIDSGFSEIRGYYINDELHKEKISVHRLLNELGNSEYELVSCFEH